MVLVLTSGAILISFAQERARFDVGHDSLKPDRPSGRLPPGGQKEEDMDRKASLAGRAGSGGGGVVSRRDFLKVTAAGAAGLLAGGLARPAAALGAVGGGHHGNLGAITKQLKGTGLFVGNEFLHWNDATRRKVFAQIRHWKFDFVCPKVGG